MARTISVALKNHIAGSTVTIATCVRITRTDNLVLGFTDHQEDLVVDDVTYMADGGMTPTAFQEAQGLSPNNADKEIIFQDDGITEHDLRSGVYDDAEMLFFIVNYKDLTMGKMILGRGYLGQVRIRDDGTGVVEFRSLSQKLQQEMGDLNQETCRCLRLGDDQCQFDTSGDTADGYPAQSFGTVGTVTNKSQFIVSGLPSVPADFYNNGIIYWQDGQNLGLQAEILSYNTTTHEIILVEPAIFTVANGDVLVAEVGDDRRLETCKNRFNNVVNFRGEPFVPRVSHLNDVNKA